MSRNLAPHLSTDVSDLSIPNPHVFMHADISLKLSRCIHMIDGNEERKERKNKRIKWSKVGHVGVPEHSHFLTYGLSLRICGQVRHWDDLAPHLVG